MPPRDIVQQLYQCPGVSFETVRMKYIFNEKSGKM
jgi:hypothetical protein